MIIYKIETLSFNHIERISNEIFTIPKLMIKNIYQNKFLTIS
jgi:hypothetical protein